MGLRSFYATRLAPRRSVSLFNARVMPPLDRAAERLFGRTITGSLLPTLMLTTTGRKSGQPRTSPLLFVEHDGGWVVVGTNFGQEHHPAWTGNLLANPDAEVRLAGRTLPVRARQVTGPELDGLWPRFARLYPGYDAYRARISRDARMFHLRPVETGLPGSQAG